ncbi:maleylacetate reductase [Sphingomonas sp.]|uniref:maleylacetate reductase n=1 Tax=Sphingomonas sp. TaxID=28214 RepID=UPI000DAFF6B1|nr:maleylacetate reductase [Sphingomonas sp.]PZU10775.1 MAG: maleylacetate reductase [Sphingomonas sp.]
MIAFIHQFKAQRVLFGNGVLDRVAGELETLGAERTIVLTTPEQARSGEAVAALIGTRTVGHLAVARMHTPTDVTADALAAARALDADSIVSIGGGSTIGLGKALSVRTGWPHLAIPTTYAGSEMTPILGETENGQKTTRRDDAILPATVVYDVDLTRTLPQVVRVTSGMNAIAHAIEALYAPDTTPVIDLMALEGMRLILPALERRRASPDDDAALAELLRGAWLCGACLGATTMSLHHKLAHILGGSFVLPHAELHTVLIPHVLAFNAPCVPEVDQRIRVALGCYEEPGGFLFDRITALGGPTSLRDLGMPQDGIPRAALLATSNAYANPRTPDVGAIEGMLHRAWAGERPIAD